MNLRKTNTAAAQRYVNLRDWATYAGVGLSTAKKAAVAIGAEKRIGKRCIYDLQALDVYFADHDVLEG